MDDERLLMEDVVALCRDLDGVDGVMGFTRARDALRWLEWERVDVALLDIDMPDMTGIELAAAIHEMQPDAAVIFLTGYAQYALDAFQVHASGYLLKPVKREQLAREITYAARGLPPRPTARAEARTFGNFDLLVDGKPVAFRQAKCKELLAYLIDRHGASVTRREAFAVLWEDRLYDRPMQKQFDVIIRSLRATLEECGVGGIFEMHNATMRVDPERISCDAWRLLGGDPGAAGAYRGEYMNNYSWASLTESALSRHSGKGWSINKS